MSYDEQRISDQIDGGLYHKNQQEMTQETMTKEQTAIEILVEHIRFMGLTGLPPDWELVNNAIDQSKRELSAERERLEGLIKNEPVSFFLVNIMRSLPNEKWPDLINSLNERCSLPTAERERAGKLIGALNEYIVLLGEELDEVMGFVNAHQWKSTRFEKGEELRQNIKQTASAYQENTNPSS